MNRMRTTDLWFAAFLIHKGHTLSDYTVVSRGKGEFCFDVSDAEWKKLKLEFNNSDLSKIKQVIEQLKDLCY